MKDPSNIIFFSACALIIVGFSISTALAEIEQESDDSVVLNPTIIAQAQTTTTADQSTQSQSQTKPKTQTQTTTTKTPSGAEVKTEVTQKVENIIKPDRDGDGLIDELDPHPDIPEVYIVVDANANGIVDSFEQMNLSELP